MANSAVIAGHRAAKAAPLEAPRIRQCGASDCKVYFIDTSKAHRRQWCSMQNCGNREKQRRWRSGAD
jgi:predicted RNA-binding Zn ribbon-like protein